MCFFIEGHSTGSLLIIDYEIIGRNRQNLRINIKDENFQKIIYKNDNNTNQDKFSISLNIDTSHDYSLC